MRRMSLMGDALSHADAAGRGHRLYFAGLSLPAMGLGGFVAGISVALIAGLVSRFTSVRGTPALPRFTCWRCRWACCWCPSTAAMSI